MGHIISKGGLSPNPDKVKAIQEAARPRTRKELKSWLGMVGFYQNYIQWLKENTKIYTTRRVCYGHFTK